MTGSPAPYTAHPRSRGENDGGKERVIEHHGSSPLTRGKRIVIEHSHNNHGLIPAHAGKTRCVMVGAFRSRAHPRSRGENPPNPSHAALPQGLIPAHAGKTCITSWVWLASAGSSPLTRGKQGTHTGATQPHRLIPAHAGKTLSTHTSPTRVTAHPRSRGENELIGKSYQFNQGSSPLTRGKRLRGHHQFPPSRLIPAHAGKTP